MGRPDALFRILCSALAIIGRDFPAFITAVSQRLLPARTLVAWPPRRSQSFYRLFSYCFQNPAFSREWKSSRMSHITHVTRRSDLIDD